MLHHGGTKSLGTLLFLLYRGQISYLQRRASQGSRHKGGRDMSVYKDIAILGIVVWEQKREAENDIPAEETNHVSNNTEA